MSQEHESSFAGFMEGYKKGTGEKTIRNDKTWVRMTCKDQQHGDWKDREIGYIDGYVTSNNRPYVAIVIDKKK